MAEIVRSSRGIEDALGIGAGTNAARRSFLVCRQIIPQKLRKTFDAIPRDVDKKNVGSTEKHCGRDLQWNNEHDRRSRNDRPQNVPDVSASSHVVIARAPAEHQVPCVRKLRLQTRQRTPYLRQGQPEFRVPAAEDDTDDLVSRCRCSNWALPALSGCNQPTRKGSRLQQQKQKKPNIVSVD